MSNFQNHFHKSRVFELLIDSFKKLCNSSADYSLLDVLFRVTIIQADDGKLFENVGVGVHKNRVDAMGDYKERGSFDIKVKTILLRDLQYYIEKSIGVRSSRFNNWKTFHASKHVGIETNTSIYGLTFMYVGTPATFLREQGTFSN